MHPLRVPWAIVTQTGFLAIYGVVGAFGNMAAGFRGLLAGLKGEIGRPDSFYKVELNRPEHLVDWADVVSGGCVAHL